MNLLGTATSVVSLKVQTFSCLFQDTQINQLLYKMKSIIPPTFQSKSYYTVISGKISVSLDLGIILKRRRLILTNLATFPPPPVTPV